MDVFSWYQIPMSKYMPVVTIIVTVVIAVVNILIAIKIKFAPDVTTLMRDIKSMATRVILWLTNAASAGVIIWWFVSPGPVDRAFIFFVIFNFFLLFYSFVMLWVHRLLEMILDAHRIDGRILDVIGGMNRNIELLSKVLPSVTLSPLPPIPEK